MADVLGAARPAAVCRELTKLHEEVRRGALSDLAEQYSGEPPRGEIVVCVGPPLAREAGEAGLDEALAAALEDMGVRDAAAAVSAALGLPKREVYNRALELKKAQER